APPPAAGVPIGANILQPHPAIIGTARLGTELRRGVYLARPSRGRGKRRWRDKRNWGGRRSRLLAQGTGRFVGETSKRLGILGVLVEQRGRLAWGRADCDWGAYPLFIQDDT